jgi:hypothetical protein
MSRILLQTTIAEHGRRFNLAVVLDGERADSGADGPATVGANLPPKIWNVIRGFDDIICSRPPAGGVTNNCPKAR